MYTLSPGTQGYATRMHGARVCKGRGKGFGGVYSRLPARKNYARAHAWGAGTQMQGARVRRRVFAFPTPDSSPTV